MVLCAPLLHLPAASVYWGGYDYTITHFIRGLNNNPVANTLFTWLTFTADTLFMVLIIAALYLGGYKKEALVFAAVFLVTYVVVHAGIKYLVARPRPSDLGVKPKSEPSFPSGHTANAFALATTLTYYHRKVAPFLFAWALLVAFSRPFLGVHYFTDLLGGAAVGIVVSFIITRISARYDAQIIRFVERLPPHRRSAA
ncbi:MAG TPA: phosphatase PAP2 family protein [Candidatus Bathyarchaeia archaeon]|nr:phosphatase PAP2 family protein [Candidatus Bathyarchaeia archaeon]